MITENNNQPVNRLPEQALEPPEYDVPICPFCGHECETFYADGNGNYFACDQCVKEIEADSLINDYEGLI